MPLLLAPVPVTPPPVITPPPVEAAPPPWALGVRWTAPDGSVTNLNEWGRLHLLTDVDGFGAAPRETTRADLATGGTWARWSHAAERLVTLPLLIAPAADALATRRALTRAFLQTTPAAGAPRPGVLRVTRPDGTWRELSALYVDGLSWTEAEGSGVDWASAVVQLVAPDPWFYGPETIALAFSDTTSSRDYFHPYETVAGGRTLGSVTVSVDSDVNVDPVWTITGPAVSVAVRYEPDGPGFTYGALAAGRVITVDVGAGTITDETGANQAAGIGWPTSALFQLQPGDNALLLSIIGGQPGVSGISLRFRPRYESA